jgi:GNAT superfamily N-acetyltransferase
LFDIKFIEDITGHKVVIALAKCMVEIGEKYKSFDIPIGYGQSAFYIENNEIITGALSFRKLEYESTYWIYCAYVDPVVRRRGIYKAMYNALLKRAEKEHIARISGGIAINNTTMIHAAKSVGRIPISINYTAILKS